MNIPSDMEIMACDAFIEISDAAPNGVLWADEYEQASEYARLTWGGSVARHVHSDAVEKIKDTAIYAEYPMEEVTTPAGNTAFAFEMKDGRIV